MEKRIRTLYIVTIVAILAFLGMQIYWLYGRYEYTLGEYEAAAYRTIVQTVAELNESRSESPDSAQRVRTQRSHYNLNHDSDSTGRRRTTAIVVSQKYYAHELLGIKENRPLTDEEKDRVANMIMENDSLIEKQEVSYKIDNMASEAAIWGALKHVDVEFQLPLTTESVTSILESKGITAEVGLIRTDSMVWDPSVVRHATAFVPEAVVSVPYSELECKSVLVTGHLPVVQIFRDMLGSLAVVALLSLFLIVCLVWQFSTILKLNRLDRMRNDFITTMIHELKRPISTLKMCVSGIENEAMMSQPDVKRELVGETRGALDILSAYFSKLRDITFNDVGQIPLNITEINLRELFDDVCAAVTVPADRSVDFANDIAAGITVSADRTHLFNILSNLVENSVKYAGDTIEVRASALVDERYVTVTVGDNGCGISRDDLPHIFKRFYRGRASAAGQPGMGLGLAYVRLLVGAHGGDITAESRENGGTNFIIRLPR